ncbi:MAG: 30S ribosomal protein S6 [Saprospiraceae bacterium]|nr:30S ribosomal protein S6 [Saprospiraceae bacterium]
MNQYEVNFIIDPVLSGDEIKTTAKTYETLLADEGCEIVNVNEMGLRQMAYPINKRTSGIYHCVEFKTPSGSIIPKLELALRRDERIMRFLSVRLDKYGIQYNEDRRAGKIQSYKKKDPRRKPTDVVMPPKEEEIIAKAPEVVVPPVVVNEEE